jgi:imidazolonepropionase
MIEVDLLITNAAQVATCAAPSGPKRGSEMQDVGLIALGAVAVSDGEIVAVGPAAEVAGTHRARRTLDATGRAICPGFVDGHTHAVYAGDRLDEFEMRLRGASYMEIMQAGGGIVRTMTATRAASLGQLVAEARPRLDAMLALGTTTAEIKTGYGLSPASELTMLRAIEALDALHPIDLLPTFLGAHAIPPAYKTHPDGYVDLVIDQMLPTAALWFQNSTFKTQNSKLKTQNSKLFCDVFCEANVFSLAQSRRVLTAGLAHGLRPKLHADEFISLGGVGLAVELGAVSVDHLEATPPADIDRLAASGTVGVVMPAVNFNLGSHEFAPARAMLDAGVALALATDLNPGSAPCPSMQFVMALAARYQRLLPAEALNAATINAAHALGLGERLGSLEVGKQADLLILTVPDYRQLVYQFGGNLVGQVVKRGRLMTAL